VYLDHHERREHPDPRVEGTEKRGLAVPTLAPWTLSLLGSAAPRRLLREGRSESTETLARSTRSGFDPSESGFYPTGSGFDPGESGFHSSGSVPQSSGSGVGSRKSRFEVARNGVFKTGRRFGSTGSAFLDAECRFSRSGEDVLRRDRAYLSPRNGFR
jgi:hypothetical protein